MPRTELASTVAQSCALAETTTPRAELICAAHALYRACHLQPPPAVLVARSGDDFVRMLALLTFRPRMIFDRLLFTLAYPCLFLAILVLAWVRKDPSQLAANTNLALDLCLSASALVLSVWGSRVPSRMPFSPTVSVLLAGYATGVGFGAALAWLLGGNEFHVLFGAIAGNAGAVLVHYGGLLLWAAWGRWSLGRHGEARVPLSGDRVIHDVLSPRLRSAYDDLTTQYSFRHDRAMNSFQQEPPPTAASMQANAAGYNESLWRESGPLLGPVVARYGAIRLICGYALERVATVNELPVVLQAAIELDARVDAATFLAKTALVLPADSPLSVAEPHLGPTRSWRRSSCSPYQKILAACNASLLTRVAIDLAQSQEAAERHLGNAVVRLEDAYRRQIAISLMGEARLITATGIRPVQSDGFGELYLIGPEQTPLAFVKVRDASPTRDGLYREHWLSVPPHVATAREGIAWTFGLAEKAYAPTTES